VLDPVSEFENKDELDRQNAIKHAAMDDLIRSSESKFLTVEHNGKSIRIRPAIPGLARRQVLKLASKYKGIDIEALKAGTPRQEDLGSLAELSGDEEDQLYATLASICLDAPYNDPENWRYYDGITGEAAIIYQKAQDAMKEAQATAISFRQKPGRTKSD
jgi:hypothetical protein